MTPHEILGVYPEASQADIKARFRYLAKTQHPDVGGDSTQFRLIKQAYDELMRDETIIPGEGLVRISALTDTQKLGIRQRLALRLRQIEYQERSIESHAGHWAEDRMELHRQPLRDKRAAIEAALKLLS